MVQYEQQYSPVHQPGMEDRHSPIHQPWMEEQQFSLGHEPGIKSSIILLSDRDGGTAFT